MKFFSLSLCIAILSWSSRVNDDEDDDVDEDEIEFQGVYSCEDVI